VKLRSRIAAAAAGVGLIAGFTMIGTGPAQAQDTILLECDHVGGSAGIKPALSEVAVANTAVSVKGPLRDSITVPFKPVTYTRDCTGLLATDDVPGPNNDGAGAVDDVGPLTKVAGKLVGSATCNLTADPPITDPLDPLDGKLTFTFTTLDALLKPWASQQYIRIGQGDNPAAPDELAVKSGIVIKGAGIGADVFGSFIFAPYDAKTKADFDSNPATPPTLRPLQSQLNAGGDLVAGAGSLALGGECIDPGTTDLATAWFSTDGTNLLFSPFNSSLGVVLPDTTP
jgi:hypothetical protein